MNEPFAAIARPDHDGWTGTGVLALDGTGTPTTLGRSLWWTLRDDFHGAVPAFLDAWLSGPGNGMFPRRHEHGACSPETCDPAHVEWVYVFHDRVLAIQYSATCYPHERAAERDGDGPRLRHCLYGVFPLSGPEPDWAGIEAEVKRQRHLRSISRAAIRRSIRNVPVALRGQNHKGA